MKKSTPNRKPTIAKISESLGLSERRVSQLKRSGMPIDSVEAALAWRKGRELETSASGSADELRREKTRLTRAQAEKVELELSVRRSELIPRDVVQEAMTRIGRTFGGIMTALITELPPICEGLSAAASEPLVEDRVRKIQSEFANLESEFWNHHREDS